MKVQISEAEFFKFLDSLASEKEIMVSSAVNKEKGTVTIYISPSSSFLEGLFGEKELCTEGKKIELRVYMSKFVNGEKVEEQIVGCKIAYEFDLDHLVSTVNQIKNSVAELQAKISAFKDGVMELTKKQIEV